jgi:hypothetical protein
VVGVPQGLRGGPVGGGGAKIVLAMAENTKEKGLKIKAQKQIYEVLFYKERLM